MRTFLLGGLTSALLMGLAPLSLAQQPAAPQGQPAPPPPAVKVGDAAPDFTMPYLSMPAGGKLETKQVHLGDFKGKKNVVLAFFVAAFSPG